MNNISKTQKDFFKNEGYLIIENLISKEEINYYKKIYDDFLTNTIDALAYRSDLSGNQSG